MSRPGLVTTVAMLFLVAFGIKAAIFPLFFWLPASTTRRRWRSRRDLRRAC
jgi:formate hydrogenlyase subunit 3/multisubunit Na+/H+ antiporter MnhD subunit